MIIIKMEQDKSLLVTRKPILHQFEHKADQLLFLIPPNIDNVDLANANVIARFILPSGMGMTKGLARKEELYQNYAQYVTSLTSVMTAEAGEIELCLSIVDKQGAVVLRSSPAFLRILPSISSDELLEEGQLDQLDWLTMQLARMETRVEETDAKKADNLIFDAETSTIQLTANGIPIGETGSMSAPTPASALRISSLRRRARWSSASATAPRKISAVCWMSAAPSTCPTSTTGRF